MQAARAGYAVYAVGRNVRALAALSGQIVEEGGTIVTDAVDISDPAHAPGLIGRAIGAFGHIDVLVNNAGAAAVGPHRNANRRATPRPNSERTSSVRLALTREALPTLRASRGHVFMIGSGVARVPVLGMGAYPPSKAALRSATSILRREIAALDIAVTYVDPGAVDTGFMTRAGMPGAPRDVLISPELVARKILLAITTRPRVLNVAPLQTAAVALGEVFPALAEAVLEHNPNMIGTGPSIAALELQRDANGGRGEKIALPSSRPLPARTGSRRSAGRTAGNAGAAARSAPAAVLGAAIHACALRAARRYATRQRCGAGRGTRRTRPPSRRRTNSRLRAGNMSRRKCRSTNPSRLRMRMQPRNRRSPPPPDLAPSAESAASPLGDHEDDDAFGSHEQTAHHDVEPSMTGSSFDAALEPLQRRMERAKLTTDFIRSLLVHDAVIDVGEAAMRWAGMPNKHERALTSEVFFALAEWGYLAPRADGRYRVLYEADGDPAV